MNNNDNKNYLDNVRNQYESLPYPPCDPSDDKTQLRESNIDTLFLINQHCFKGRRDLKKGFRVLAAGGGTGFGSIYLAEQLRGTPAEVVHVDMSTASIAIAKERAKVRKLENISFIHASLLDLPSLGLASFDYVNCSGVLHHLADPDEGLKALTSVLKEDGAIGVMVYAQYGRSAIYQTQSLMALINKNEPVIQQRVDNLKQVMPLLPANHILNHWKKNNNAKDLESDSGLYDLLLHEQDRAYTILEVYDWVESNGLHIPVTPGFCGEQAFYKPSTFITDSTLLASINALPLKEQYAIGELMHGRILMHSFYVTKQAGTAATLADEDLALSFRPESQRGNRQRATTQTTGPVYFEVGSVRYSMPSNNASAFFFSLFDGKTPIADILSKTSAQTGYSIPQIKNYFYPSLEALLELSAVYLHHPSVSPDMDPLEMQQRVMDFYS